MRTGLHRCQCGEFQNANMWKARLHVARLYAAHTDVLLAVNLYVTNVAVLCSAKRFCTVTVPLRTKHQRTYIHENTRSQLLPSMPHRKAHTCQAVWWQAHEHGVLQSNDVYGIVAAICRCNYLSLSSLEVVAKYGSSRSFSQRQVRGVSHCRSTNFLYLG